MAQYPFLSRMGYSCLLHAAPIFLERRSDRGRALAGMGPHFRGQRREETEQGSDLGGIFDLLPRGIDYRQITQRAWAPSKIRHAQGEYMDTPWSAHDRRLKIRPPIAESGVD